MSLSRLATATALAALLTAPALPGERPRETPLGMVKALHSAFGEHHARAVHTKGVVLEGTFTPAKGASELVREPIFGGDTFPVVARFSLFAGVPDLPDNDDGASPAGFAVKIVTPDGDDFDIEANQHKDFIVATFDQFAVFLRAVGATRPDTPHPNPVEQFLAAHPHAKEFLASRTYPASYAEAMYFGINAVKFTNAKGKSVFVRYKFVPQAGEHYLSPDERKARSKSYLQDEIVQRLSAKPVVFVWYAQIAAAGDRIDDPSIAWPDSRKTVELGTFRLTGLPADPEGVQKSLLFLPVSPIPASRRPIRCWSCATPPIRSHSANGSDQERTLRRHCPGEVPALLEKACVKWL